MSKSGVLQLTSPGKAYAALLLRFLDFFLDGLAEAGGGIGEEVLLLNSTVLDVAKSEDEGITTDNRSF